MKLATARHRSSHGRDDSETVLIDQRKTMLKLAGSDYIDRIVDGRGPRQRIITQPRPFPDIEGAGNSPIWSRMTPSRTC